jgi:ubiquitin-conjugating enzyme E2 D/E
MFGHNQFQPKPLPSATKRLLSDLRELQADLSDTDTITALPLESNLFEWHANIVAPSDSRYAGAVFHVVLTFPYNYPVAAPKGVLKSRLSHSHVFPTWICLDMLETHQSHERHSGWSSAYSIPAILLQLQAFLLEEELFLV